MNSRSHDKDLKDDIELKVMIVLDLFMHTLVLSVDLYGADRAEDDARIFQPTGLAAPVRLTVKRIYKKKDVIDFLTASSGPGECRLETGIDRRSSRPGINSI